jgi:hypothetical protein
MRPIIGWHSPRPSLHVAGLILNSPVWNGFAGGEQGFQSVRSEKGVIRCSNNNMIVRQANHLKVFRRLSRRSVSAVSSSNDIVPRATLARVSAVFASKFRRSILQCPVS